MNKEMVLLDRLLLVTFFTVREGKLFFQKHLSVILSTGGGSASGQVCIQEVGRPTGGYLHRGLGTGGSASGGRIYIQEGLHPGGLPTARGCASRGGPHSRGDLHPNPAPYWHLVAATAASATYWNAFLYFVPLYVRIIVFTQRDW